MFNFELVTFPILSSYLWLVPAILINIAHIYHPYAEFLREDLPKAECFSKATECCHVVVLREPESVQLLLYVGEWLQVGASGKPAPCGQM